ncbi:MAG: HD family phosphohydrolase [Clostridia bacterium]|nr:HD family phosphohydrolase [Clostridia bacterium]
MTEWIKLKLNLKTYSSYEEEYERCVKDLIQHEMVLSMKNFIQHGDVNCLEHSICVSYNSYMICRKLKLDYRSAARGGLLHDFFLYDWHTEKPYKGLHGFIHPTVAFKNANMHFGLNDMEKDIILKHMWPLTIRLPKYRETVIVLLVDKYCAMMEIMNWSEQKNVYGLKDILDF